MLRNFCKNICCQDFQNIAQSGHTGHDKKIA